MALDIMRYRYWYASTCRGSVEAGLFILMLRQLTCTVFISLWGTQHSSCWKIRDNSMLLLCPTIRRVGQIQISYHREVCCLLPHYVSVLQWSSYSSGSVCGSQQGEMILMTLCTVHLHHLHLHQLIMLYKVSLMKMPIEPSSSKMALPV